MTFLLDTNVVSEWVKPQPNQAVIAWLDAVDEDRVFLSVMTLMELRHGIERLQPGKRRKRLQDWLEQELPLRFESRILDIDRAIAHECGALLAQQEAAGRPLGVVDAYLAATARAHGLTLVTRNDSDFKAAVPCLNPWLSS